MRDSGTPLTWAWPIWQGGGVGDVDFGSEEFGKRLWCFPAVSFHHLAPGVVEDLWRFEQGRMMMEERKLLEGSLPSVIRHREVFEEYILPRTAESRPDWENHSDDDRGLVASLEDCREICQVDETCVQFMLHSTGRCLIAARPSLGEASTEGSVSGWIQERMSRFREEAEECGDEGWIL